MLVKYNGYKKPNTNDMCVALCYFSPVKYIQPLYNLRAFLTELSAYSIPYYIIELLYPNQTQQIPNSIIVKANTVCFVKENLWNILENRIPDRYTKIAFMDGDVLYTDQNWFDKTSELLDIYDCGMIHEYAYHSSRYKEQDHHIQQKHLLVAITKIFQDSSIPWWKFHPGFNIAINREFFHKIKGFYEYGITGYGDVLFWWSFINDNHSIEKKDCPCADFLTSYKFKEYADIYQQYKTNILNLSNVNNTFYIPNNIAMHLFHGSRNHRYYNSRNGYVDGKVNTSKNQDGVIEISIDGPNTDLIQYWINRREDD